MSSAERFEVLEGGPDAAERTERLVEGAAVLESTRRGSIIQHERFLLTLAAALMVIGLAVIVVGWAGAADATIIEKQFPYLISGGLLGLGLTVIGALTMFSHWLTVGIREARAREAVRVTDEALRAAQHAELIEEVRRLAGSLGPPTQATKAARRSRS